MNMTRAVDARTHAVSPALILILVSFTSGGADRRRQRGGSEGAGYGPTATLAEECVAPRDPKLRLELDRRRWCVRTVDVECDYGDLVEAVGKLVTPDSGNRESMPLGLLSVLSVCG